MCKIAEALCLKKVRATLTNFVRIARGTRPKECGKFASLNLDTLCSGKVHLSNDVRYLYRSIREQLTDSTSPRMQKRSLSN